jgi:predicted NBD/HSP70 family sugar kinase
MTESSGTPDARTHPLVAPRPELLASITDRHVLTAAWVAADPISRAEIAHFTGLSKPAVSAAAARLVKRGVLEEVGIRSGRRGGVATLFQVNPQYGASLAVAIESNAVTVQTRDFAGKVRDVLTSELSPDTETDVLIAETNELLAAARRGLSTPILAAAVSIADPFDIAAQSPVVLERSVFPAARINAARDLNLGDAHRVVTDNDVNWATLGEYRQGSLQECKNFVYVYCGQGLGAGLMLDGRLLHAGGNSDEDLTERLASLGLGTPPRYGLELAKAAHLFTAEPISDQASAVIDTLALAIANITIVLNPDAVALGGPLCAFTPFTEQLRIRIEELSIDPPRVILSASTPLLGASIEAHRLAVQDAGALPFEEDAA